MPNTPVPGVLRRLRRALGRAESSATDAQLLERFLAQRDEDAFELLVWRHERLVLSVCRRILRDAQDAEDAFQATFLTLVRKGGSISRGQALASWLYQVACRIALRARAGLAARAGRERQGLDLSGLPAATEGDAAEQRELGPLLDEEISRLPEKYRAAVVLCYLEGQTYDQAARRLGCPLGTLATRLGHARARLRARLARRGVGLGAGALAAVLCERAAAAAVPGALVSATVKAAAGVAAGRAAAGVVAPQVAAMTEGALRAMMMTKLKIAAALLLLVGLLGGGITWLTPGGQAARADGQKNAPVPGGKAAPKTDQERFQGTWLVVSLNVKEQEVPEEEYRARQFIFEGDWLTMMKNGGRGAEEFSFQLDPKRKPKAIDLKGKAVGIYEFQGDKLRLCLTDDEEPRPADFKPGKRRMVIVLKRAKGTGPTPAKQSPPDARTEALKADKEKLQGGWRVLEMKAVKGQISAEPARMLWVTIAGDQFTLSSPVKDTRMSFRLDPHDNSRSIDFEGDLSYVGIYRFETDRLLLSLAKKDAPRPTDFKPGPQQILMVLTRAKVAQADEATLKIQVNALREIVSRLQASKDRLREELKRHEGLVASKHEIEGVLKEVNVEKNVVSVTLGRTNLALNSVPLAVRAKFFLGLKECTINDLKPGMEVTLRLENSGDRSEVVRIEASPAAGKE